MLQKQTRQLYPANQENSFVGEPAYPQPLAVLKHPTSNTDP